MLRATAALRRKPDAGLTLVEVLVVLSIIAITTGAAMLRLGLGGVQDNLLATATTMATAVTEASDAALATGHDRVLNLRPDAYLIAADGSTADPVWRQTPGLKLAASQGGAGPWRLSADAASAPFDLRLSAGPQTVTLRFDGLRATVAGAP